MSPQPRAEKARPSRRQGRPDAGAEGASAQSRPLEASRARALASRLLTWFDANRRALPWRDAPTPYRVWISEIMLQQTRVETVKDYYRRWMERFPDVESLAAAREEEVMSVWQGLGYYSRARRLLEGARFLVRERGGQLPAEPHELLEVPGIGPYSAGAIASIAHGRRAPLVDGNVVRVLTRTFAWAGDPAQSRLKNELWARAEQLVPAERPGDFNQALMELGALICTPQTPACGSCPWVLECEAFARGEVTRYPEKPRPRPATEVRVLVLLLRHRGALALESLPSSARWWAGLSAFPCVELGDVTAGALSAPWRERVAELGLVRPSGRAGARTLEAFVRGLLAPWGGGGASVERLAPLDHRVTRFQLQLLPVLVELPGPRPRIAGHRWLRPGELAEIPLPAPHRRLLTRLLARP